jgi:hypothetical protein
VTALVGERVLAGAALVVKIVGDFEKVGLIVVGARVGQARSTALPAIPGEPTEES